MSYLHIPNLYKEQDILLFRECYALEKIHGTSAHISFKSMPIIALGPDGIQVEYFSGGEKHENFKKLFNETFLLEKVRELNLGIMEKIIIYGEAYGGKQQGMSDTYGKELKFVAFDVRIGNNWLSVPQAEEIVKQLGLEFVYYYKLPTELGCLDRERDEDSVQAVRNGVGRGKKREGIVLRPLIELIKNNGERIIAKHKRDDFRETKTPRNINEETLKLLTDAKTIAEEWVTEQRLSHILDKIHDIEIEKTGEVIKAMIEDVEREGKGEITESKDVRVAIGKKTVELFKRRLKNGLLSS
jgi:hypothetical protein